MDEIMETCTAMEKANCDMFLLVIGSWMYTSLVTTAVNSLGGKPCVMYGLCSTRSPTAPSACRCSCAT